MPDCIRANEKKKKVKQKSVKIKGAKCELISKQYHEI